MDPSDDGGASSDIDAGRDGDGEERRRAIALLEATHAFPVEYHLSVITVYDEGVFGELRAAVEAGLSEGLGEGAYVRTASSGGKYASHRFRVWCESAEAVLAVYGRIRGVRGVKQVL